MPNNFEILAGFLERFEHEVEGRELPEPPQELRNQLREMARGQLPRTKCAEVLTLLSRNPGWIALLADEVKALRSGAAAPE